MQQWRNERGVILDWLLKVVLVLALVGVVVFEMASLVVNHVGLDSAANDIALAVSTSVSSRGFTSQADLEEEVGSLAKEAGARVVKVRLNEVEHRLRIKLARRAETLIVGRVPALRPWTRATAASSAGTG